MNLLRRLQITHPIFLSPMAGVCTPQLAAEVSEAGGLGALGFGAQPAEAARKQIEEVRKLTNRPFQINFFCHQSEPYDEERAKQWIEHLRPHFEKVGASPPTKLNNLYQSFIDTDDFLNLVLDTKPTAVSFHFGIPKPHQIQALKSAGILTMACATSLPEAKTIEAAGIDVIIAQGIEAGGHRGVFVASQDSAMSTLDLLRLIKQSCKLPVVAAGGIMNGKQAKLFLNEGAEAVQMGTAFIQCKSSQASPAFRQALFSQPVTQITPCISGRPARGLVNSWHTLVDTPSRPSVAQYPHAYDVAKQLAAKDPNFSVFLAGLNVRQIRDLSALELVQLVAKEMTE